jgi:hypothetical protein
MEARAPRPWRGRRTSDVPKPALGPGQLLVRVIAGPWVIATAGPQNQRTFPGAAAEAR